MHLANLADRAFIDESFGRAVGWHPCQGPINRQLPVRFLRGCDHRVGLVHRVGKRLFQQHMDPEFQNAPRPQSVFRRGRAKDHQFRLGLFEALPVVSKNRLRRHVQAVDDTAHPRPRFIADTDQFALRMSSNHAQVVAHVHVCEINAGDAQLTHWSGWRTK